MSTPADTLQSDSQPFRAIKIPRSRKNPAIKTQVIARYAQGQDKTSIGKDLGITRNTVRAIVKECDVDRHLEANRTVSLGLISPAIQVIHERLKKGSENAAIKVLENTIWPLNAKQGRAPDQGLTLAIQNLMGNVTVQSPSNQVDTAAQPIEVKPEKPTDR